MTGTALSEGPSITDEPIRDKAKSGLDPTRAACAALALKESLAAIAGDDDDLFADMIEGETDLFEIIDRLLERITLHKGLAEGVQRTIGDLRARQERFDARVDDDRVLIEQALTIAGLQKSIQRPTATIGLAKRQPRLVVDEEADIPADYWKPGDPVLDRAALKAAVEHRDAQVALARRLAESAHPDDPRAQEAAIIKALGNLGPIPGVHLEQPAPSLTIRMK